MAFDSSAQMHRLSTLLMYVWSVFQYTVLLLLLVATHCGAADHGLAAGHFGRLGSLYATATMGSNTANRTHVDNL